MASSQAYCDAVAEEQESVTAAFSANTETEGSRTGWGADNATTRGKEVKDHPRRA